MHKKWMCSWDTAETFPSKAGPKTDQANWEKFIFQNMAPSEHAWTVRSWAGCPQTSFWPAGKHLWAGCPKMSFWPAGKHLWAGCPKTSFWPAGKHLWAGCPKMSFWPAGKHLWAMPQDIFLASREIPLSRMSYKVFLAIRKTPLSSMKSFWPSGKHLSAGCFWSHSGQKGNTFSLSRMPHVHDLFLVTRKNTFEQDAYEVPKHISPNLVFYAQSTITVIPGRKHVSHMTPKGKGLTTTHGTHRAAVSCGHILAKAKRETRTVSTTRRLSQFPAPKHKAGGQTRLTAWMFIAVFHRMNGHCSFTEWGFQQDLRKGPKKRTTPRLSFYTHAFPSLQVMFFGGEFCSCATTLCSVGSWWQGKLFHPNRLCWCLAKHDDWGNCSTLIGYAGVSLMTGETVPP